MSSFFIFYKKRMGLVDTTNIQNNHAGIERIQESEKAQALLKLVVDYRTHVQMYEYMPTWDILEFLQKLDNELNERYNKEVKDAERDKIKEQYFLLTKKKPFLWWSNERILEEIERYKANKQNELSDNTLDSKKSRWKTALKK